jgi:hypothetical protein
MLFKFPNHYLGSINNIIYHELVKRVRVFANILSTFFDNPNHTNSDYKSLSHSISILDGPSLSLSPTLNQNSMIYI